MGAKMAHRKNIYEFDDILRLYRSKRGIADALQIHPAQITRWGTEIPGVKQFEIMHILEKDKALDREYKFIVRERLRRAAGV